MRSSAEATAALVATERAAEAAKARLAERIAESAKYTTKVAEFRAVLAQQDAAPHPLAAGREARKRMLADEAEALETERAAFFARCAAFQAAHDPAAFAAQHAQAVAAAAAARAELAQLQEQARELRASTARAAVDASAAEERNRELAATCGGAPLRHAAAAIGAFADMLAQRFATAWPPSSKRRRRWRQSSLSWTRLRLKLLPPQRRRMRRETTARTSRMPWRRSAWSWSACGTRQRALTPSCCAR